jgi:Tfp pilus assembly protein PilO
MKSALIIIFILSTVAMFFGLAVPTYDETKVLRAEAARLDDALDKSRELRAVRQRLIEQRNNLDPLDVSRLEKLVPDHVDNVRLIIDMDHIASNNGMRLRDVSIQQQTSADLASSPPASSGMGKYGQLELSFGVESSYRDLQAFLRDLERSLRIVDVVRISFQAPDNDDLFTTRITIRTYWLRQ